MGKVSGGDHPSPCASMGLKETIQLPRVRKTYGCTRNIVFVLFLGYLPTMYLRLYSVRSGRGRSIFWRDTRFELDDMKAHRRVTPR